MTGNVVIVSGFAGSGKSTLAEKLAERFKLRCIHASSLLKELQTRDAKELDVGHTEAGSGWWESGAAEKFMKQRMEDGALDRKLDNILLKEIDAGKVIVDSWTMPWLSKRGFKIWLNAGIERRAERVAGRDNLPIEEVKEKLAKRDRDTAAIYEKLYGFRLGADFEPFDITIDTDNIGGEEVFRIAEAKAKAFLEE